MRIKNESKRIYQFNGGQILPGRVVDIENEQLAEALIKGYPNELVALDNIKAEVIKDELKEEAKKLGIKGFALMKRDVLEKKVAEAKEYLENQE